MKILYQFSSFVCTSEIHFKSRWIGIYINKDVAKKSRRIVPAELNGCFHFDYYAALVLSGLVAELNHQGACCGRGL